jgi:hypothetical protein
MGTPGGRAAAVPGAAARAGDGPAVEAEALICHRHATMRNIAKSAQPTSARARPAVTGQAPPMALAERSLSGDSRAHPVGRGDHNLRQALIGMAS